MRLILALTLPAAVGMAVLAQPIVAAVFQHGAFGVESRQAVVVALLFYLIGLPFAAVDWPLNYASYARKDTLTPALMGVLSVLVYLVVAVLLGPVMNVLGLAAGWLFVGLVVADSSKHAFHASAMLVVTRRRVGPEALAGAGRTLAAALLATVAMAGVVAAVDHLLMPYVPDSLVGWALRAGLGALAGMAVYLPLASRLGVGEIRWMYDVVRERMRRDGQGRDESGGSGDADV
jgi:putative peptidoglycan lipid II flippase